MHIIQPTIPHASLILQDTIDPNSILPLPISIRNTNKPAPVINDEADLTYDHVPRSDLQLVRSWLKTLERPKDILDSDYASLIRYATSFFKDGDRLWRRDPNGSHKIVALSETRMNILRASHDNLGHHQFYATRAALLEQFWWPHVQEDIK
ncbi:hypothetical protein C0991_001360, partial [Blastosporella zonata]